MVSNTLARHKPNQTHPAPAPLARQRQSQGLPTMASDNAFVPVKKGHVLSIYLNNLLKMFTT